MKKATETTGRGFYIILAICLVVIAVSGYVLFFQPAAPQTGAMDDTVYTADSTPAAVPDVDLPAKQSEPETKASEPSESPKQSAPPKQQTAAEPAAPIWVRPVAGEVLRPFSGDTLVKDETMGDWRTHTGADYAASAGTRVYAVSDGEVRSVETGTLYGACVTLALTDGKQAVYRGLSEQVKVKQGASVRAGDVIGTVGSENPAESAQASHLHLELYERETTLDPEDVLGGKKQQTAGHTGQAEASIKPDLSAVQSGIDIEE